MKMNKKGQLFTQSILVSIFFSVLIVSVLAIAWSSIVTDVGTNYNQSYNTSSYNTFNQINSVAPIVDTSQNQFYGNSSTSTQTDIGQISVTSAFSVIRLLGSIPGIMNTIINAAFITWWVPPAYQQLAWVFIICIFVSVSAYLVLGRR